MLDTLDCPFCGYQHRLDDGEVYEGVTSYYGDHHKMHCFECDKLFYVKEVVTREYTVAAGEAR